MANGNYTAEDAVKNDEAFRQYTVLHLERITIRLDQHEKWHSSMAKIVIATPAFLLAAFALFKLAVKTSFLP